MNNYEPTFSNLVELRSTGVICGTVIKRKEVDPILLEDCCRSRPTQLVKWTGSSSMARSRGFIRLFGESFA